MQNGSKPDLTKVTEAIKSLIWDTEELPLSSIRVIFSDQ